MHLCTLQNILKEKFWINSCWKICGGFWSLLLPGSDQLCFTGGRIACRSFLKILHCSTVLDDLSLDTPPVSPTESLGTRKLAIAPNALGVGAGTASASMPVCSNTACKEAINSSQYVDSKTLLDEHTQYKRIYQVNLWRTSIWYIVLEILSISPTMYSVAFPGKYHRSWNFLILSTSHFFICSSNPIGNLLLSLFSECKCCSNCAQKQRDIKIIQID